MKKVQLNSFNPGEVSNREYAVRTLQDMVELHEVKNNQNSILLEYRDFTITAVRLKDDDKWLFTGEKGELTFTDFNFGEHLELSIVDLNIDKPVVTAEQTILLPLLVDLIYAKLDNMDDIEIKSVMATVGYCNCAMQFNIALPKDLLVELQDVFKGLKDD